MKRKIIPLYKFMACVIKTVYEGGCQADIARELGVSEAAVSLRLKALREKGVKVPDFKGWIHESEDPNERVIRELRS